VQVVVATASTAAFREIHSTLPSKTPRGPNSTSSFEQSRACENSVGVPVFGADSAQLALLQGRWDEIHVLPGHLMARKGDAMVDVGYEGSRAGLAGAARVADVALGRFGALLPYDGAAAARTAPGPLIAPRDPCTLVSRADVEAILGALASDPVSEIVQRQVGGVPTGGARDSGFGDFRQQVQGVFRSQGIGAQMTDSGLKTDSTVAGLWDEASLVAGLGFSAVKHDVLMSLDLRTVLYDQARALIAKAMQRL
jgi:hypothetical protein